MIADSTTSAIGASAPSKQAVARVELCSRVATETPVERDAIGYSSWLFAQVSLPHRDPGPVPTYTRHHHDLVFNITPGYVGNECVGYPYGPLPRLALLALANEVKRSRSQRVQLGRNITDFLRRVGVRLHSHNYHAAPDQLRRLLFAKIQFVFHAQAHVDRMKNSPVADECTLWADHHDGVAGYVTVHRDFYQDVIEHGFPIDLDAVRALHQSALALDLYTWLAHRTFSIRENSVRISWRQIHSQVGSSYADMADFKKRAKRALAAVSAAYPSLNLGYFPGGLLIKPSLPPVLPLRRAAS